ncbi:hypothetical protein Clacol_003738 [Clathrus columnatus]|uniref:DH domain-containing protein n=1 Tax=Clathrus columnatus TaxID=1419009 RepID=A0AAV5A994_9AGAM|nr:hypothetical protein Clacol_003738 [Clathrus columnatus]
MSKTEVAELNQKLRDAEQQQQQQPMKRDISPSISKNIPVPSTDGNTINSITPTNQSPSPQPPHKFPLPKTSLNAPGTSPYSSQSRPQSIPLSLPPDPFSDLLFLGWNPDLPEPTILLRLVEIFFRCDPCGSRILHRPSFIAYLSLPPHHANFPHPAILHAICANASRWTSGDGSNIAPDGTRRDRFAEYHAAKTRFYIDQTMVSGDQIFSVLQASNILSWYLYAEGKWVEVWILAGFQTRVAVPLRLNYPGAHMKSVNNMQSGYLPPPKNTRELELRRRAWWMSLIFDRMASAGGWLHGINERDIGTELPLRAVDFESEYPVESNPQNLSNESTLIVHPPQYTDSFILLIKACMLFGKVTDFSVRMNLRGESLDLEDIRSSTAFRTLDQLTAVDFLANLPQNYKNCLGVIDESGRTTIDTDLYLVHLIPHAYVLVSQQITLVGSLSHTGFRASITLHNPFMNLSSAMDTSAARCLDASRAILDAYYLLTSTSFSIKRLHPFTIICWYLAAVVQVHLCKRLIELGDCVNESNVWGEINMLRTAMHEYGAQSPIGTVYIVRQEKLLQGLMAEILRMTSQAQPLKVGVPLFPFSHAGVFPTQNTNPKEMAAGAHIAPLPGTNFGDTDLGLDGSPPPPAPTVIWNNENVSIRTDVDTDSDTRLVNKLSFFQESSSSHIQTASGLFNEQTSSREGKQLPPEPVNAINVSHPQHSRVKQSKKSNPLVDLVETEETYVTMLSAIIRRVAAAWSKTNFPPKELDAMFRGIESIFKANRRLLSQLKEIDQNPSNPNSAKAVGDLLMNWIIDLDKPYTKFCNSYATGFDSWALITSNTMLPPILHALTTEHPLDSLNPSTSSAWTLDLLFNLPRSRLKYYRKLYARLLKSTEAGKSDHTLLTGAIEKLDMLLNILLERSNVTVHNGDQFTPITSTHVERDHKLAIGNEALQSSNANLAPPPMGGSSGSRAPLDRPTISSANSITTVLELEQNLSTKDVLDLFTLNPRPVHLQLNSPSLPFTRTIRYSGDVEIHFAPKAIPEKAQTYSNGHLFLLTDLLLLCERVSHRANDIRLLYPPLAGKHLRASGPSDEVTPGRGQSPPPPVPILKHMESEDNSPKKLVFLPERTFPQQRESLPHETANEIPIGRLSISRPPDNAHFISQGNKDMDMSFQDTPNLVVNANRISFIKAPPNLQTEFAPVQNLPIYTPVIPPPRGASNGHNLSPHPQSSGLYTNTLPGHFQTNVTLHQRSLTPSLPHFAGQQQDGVYDNPMLRKSVSTTSLNDPYYQPSRTTSLHSQDHLSGMYPTTPSRPELYQRQSRDSLPPHIHQSRTNSITTNSWSPPYDNNTSPTGSPVKNTDRLSGPTVSNVTGQFKCKVFLKLQHGQWKNLGSAKLKLYLEQPTNVKQLVVESESKDRGVLISTIVLTDGVERVGKTGVAIELSDEGSRTGIVYMIQLRNENSASGLFDSLLAGSDRAAGRRMS